MNAQSKSANARVNPGNREPGRFSAMAGIEKSPARLRIKSTKSQEHHHQPNAGLRSIRGLMIRLGWLRLFKAIVSDTCVRR
jgi:hypothetical protein